MKQRKWLMGVLLLFPVLSLLVFGLLQSRSQTASKAPMSFGGFTVASIPIQQRNRSNPFSPETLVKIKINIAQNLLGKHLFPMSTASKMRVKNEHLSDVRGVKYFLTVPANSLAPKEKLNVTSMLIERDGSAITYYYQLNLAQYPKSAGTMILHAVYVTDNGFQLPASVVVRK